LKKDHSDSLAHFQQLYEEERNETSRKHQEEIDSHKAELVRVTDEFTAKVGELEARIESLIATHTTEKEKLTADKDAMIADAESRRETMEAELRKELADLKEAFERSQNQLMVCSCRHG
jgi:chromosome segregation ATPase